MAHRNIKKKRHPLAKGPIVGVRLNEQDMADLAECATLESQQRQAIVHESTLLRELGMPPVRARLAELKAESIRSESDRRAEEDRRSGDERRAPAPVLTEQQ